MSFDGVTFGDRIVAAVRGYLGRELEPLQRRLTALEAIERKPSVTGAMIDQGGGLTLAMSDGTLLQLGKVVGEPGPRGAPGVDGIGFDEFAIALGEDDRTLSITAANAEKAVSWEIPLPYPLDRGVWAEGRAYQRGDAVSWSGSLFIAQKDAPAGNPDHSDDWRLAVKRGQNGKDLRA